MSVLEVLGVDDVSTDTADLHLHTRAGPEFVRVYLQMFALRKFDVLLVLSTFHKRRR